MKCSLPHCAREADGETTFRGHSVCSVHERKHWASDGSYIWKKLGIYEEMKEKERQMEL